MLDLLRRRVTTPTVTNLLDQVDRSHPLAQRLVGCYVIGGRGGRILPNLAGRPANPGTVGTGVTSSGRRRTFDGTANGYIDLGGNFGEGAITGAPLTVVLMDVYAPSHVAADNMIFGRFGATAFLQFDQIAAGSVNVNYGQFPGTSTGIAGATVLPVNTSLQLAFTMTGAGVATLYVNAVSDGTVTGGFADFTDTTAYRLGMRGGTNDLPWVGSLGGLLFYRRVLSVAELFVLKSAPWCMLAPPVLLNPPDAGPPPPATLAGLNRRAPYYVPARIY